MDINTVYGVYSNGRRANVVVSNSGIEYRHGMKFKKSSTTILNSTIYGATNSNLEFAYAIENDETELTIYNSTIYGAKKSTITRGSSYAIHSIVAPLKIKNSTICGAEDSKIEGYAYGISGNIDVGAITNSTIYGAIGSNLEQGVYGVEYSGSLLVEKSTIFGSANNSEALSNSYGIDYTEYSWSKNRRDDLNIVDSTIYGMYENSIAHYSIAISFNGEKKSKFSISNSQIYGERGCYNGEYGVEAINNRSETKIVKRGNSVVKNRYDDIDNLWDSSDLKSL